MPATIPPAGKALLELLPPMAALFVLEGWSSCVMLEEAAETDATAELYRELYLALSLLRTDGSELSADDVDDNAAEDAADDSEEAADKAAESVQKRYLLVYRIWKRQLRCSRSDS